MTTNQEPDARPSLSPYLTVDDARAAIDFYQRAFGATLVGQQATPDGKKLLHACLALGGGLLMLSDDFPEMCGGESRTPKALGGTAVTLHLALPDVDATWTRAVEAGASVELPLADQFWGDRYGVVVDPFGHRWSLATRKKVATQEELDAGARQHSPAAT
ncbi:glyoxalase [Sorangium cellulosum]|uniref:Glyoxalase n=1 Tax=Sorangium cellulosum TaxID=56 RepID=A0A2L0F3M7_SORCE|nr:VOC family protein [Sorangium cellulosum]AUX46146.1 glyoxalase [Sorangium cellulosum]